MCRIPVKATMQRVNGEMVMTSAEWAYIPADAIARFIIEKSGIDIASGECMSMQNRKAMYMESTDYRG